MRVHHAWHVLPALLLLLLLALAMPLVPALAQDSGSIISIDAPVDGQSAPLGQDVVFQGWAGNALGPGTGVDRVVVLDAPQAAGGVTLVEASYGGTRPDVGQAYGAAMTNSGFTATWRAAGAPGNKTLWIYAHSVANDGWTNKAVTVRLTAAPTPVPTATPVPSSQYNNQTGNQGNQYSNQGNGNYNQYRNGYSQYGNGYSQYGNGYSQYGNGYNQYGSGYGQYGNGYGQYGNGYYNQYGNGYGQYGAGLYPPYGYPVPAPNLYGIGYGVANCVVGVSGYYLNTATGLSYPTYAQCISVTTGIGTGNCVPTVSGYFNTATGLSYPTYAQCISVTTGIGTGNCVLAVSGYYVNSATGLSYPTYDQCISSGVSTVAAPTGLTVLSKTSTTVALTWAPSATAGVTTYLIQQSTSAQTGSFVNSSVSSLTSNSGTVGGLTPNTLYYFQVIAQAGTASSMPSNLAFANTNP